MAGSRPTPPRTPLQGSGQGSGQAPARTSLRCFIGLPLPTAWGLGLDALAQRLAGRLASRISWTRPGNWHVTLRFLGEVEAARLPEITRALRGVDFAPFALRLGGAGFFAQGGAPRTLWAGLAQGGEHCARLAGAVDRALEPCGLGPRTGAYRAHVTLGRVKQPCAGDDWRDAAALVSGELSGAQFSPAQVGEMILWRSVLGPQGPKYAAVEGYPARDHGGRSEEGTA